MDFIVKMLNLQFTLFLLIIIGIILNKVGIITSKNRKNFSDLLINIVLPCNIIISFLRKLSITDKFIQNCILTLILSLVIQIFTTYISKLLFIKFKSAQQNVMSYGLICSNSSFIGLPVAETLYGDIGVLYTSIFQIPIRFTMWTAGLSLFTNVDKKDALKKLLKHPCILSIFIGFLFMLIPVSMPEFFINTIQSASRCTTPLSMFVIGSILAEADIKTLFSKNVLYFSFLRLVMLPLFIFAVLKPFHLDPLLISICVIMSGMPAGSTTSILAEKYGCDSMFASKIIFVSTFFSIFTIPVLGLVIN